MRRLFVLTTFLLATALAAIGCNGATPTPTPTPTPAFGLPPLTLPGDESPHDYQTEWWYFNAHLAAEDGEQYALHDVVFQVQQLESDRTLYVRQIGLAEGSTRRHVSGERLRTTEEPLSADPGDFELVMGDSLMAGADGDTYRLQASASGWSYDLTLRATTPPVLHDDDGLVDFGEAGVTYYYTRPRLEIEGTISTGDADHRVTGLGWLDKQWGNFQPVVVFWDWASIQLDDGTDLMVTNLRNADREPIDEYVTLRRPGEDEVRIDSEGFDFEPLNDTWTSERTGTTYNTHWSLTVPSEGIDLTLEPLVIESEFASSLLGVVYWEAGVDVIDASGERAGQGFIELNWARTFTPAGD